MEPIFKWIAVSNRYTQMYLNKRLDPYGINASQYMFLVHIRRRPGITQDTLPELAHVNKSNVTRALAQLEAAGFITRESNPRDKRTAHIYPTEKLRETYPSVMEIIAAWDAVITGRLSPDEKNTLRALLMKTAQTAMDFLADDEREQPR